MAPIVKQIRNAKATIAIPRRKNVLTNLPTLRKKIMTPIVKQIRNAKAIIAIPRRKNAPTNLPTSRKKTMA